MVPHPDVFARERAYEPFLRLCNSVMLTTRQVADHWRLHPQSVHNMRQLGTGPAFVRIGGSVRYRLSEILAHELYGQDGPLTLERVSLALATMPGLKAEMRRRIEEHLKAALGQEIAPAGEICDWSGGSDR